MPRRHFYEFEAIMKRMEEETNETGRNVIHINTIQRLLRDTPTVDAVPVVHGSWEKTRLAGEYECSNCHSIEYEILTKSGFKLPNFCPNCGADMRKKVQDA